MYVTYIYIVTDRLQNDFSTFIISGSIINSTLYFNNENNYAYYQINIGLIIR
jgi:hypothetical protein